MKAVRAAVISAIVAHVLAWAAFLWLAFWPYSYQGTTTTPIGPDGSGGEAAPFSASLVEVNGLWVLIPLLAPVALTFIGQVIIVIWDGRATRNKYLMWLTAILLAVFCGLAITSIGMFYLPAALALAVSAFIMSVRATPKDQRQIMTG